MKKVIAVFTILFVCLVLVACEPIWFNYSCADLNDNVANIEIINYDNPKSKIIFDFFGNARHPDFDINKMISIQIVTEKNCANFFMEISAPTIGNYTRHINSPNGICFKVNYQNGDFDIISKDYIGKFNSTGKFVTYWGIFAQSTYEKIANTYIEIN